jgi:hypothetical protein
MKTMIRLRTAFGSLAMALALGATVLAQGVVLNELAFPQDENAPYTNSTARAITPDGRYIVGQVSGGTGTYPVKGIMWDAQTAAPVLGTQRPTYPGWIISSDNAASTIATGIGYRVPAPGVTQIVIHGSTSSGTCLFSTNDSGMTWGTKNRVNLSTYPNQSYGAANTLGTNAIDDKCYFGFLWQSGLDDLLEVVGGSGGVAPEYKAALILDEKGLGQSDTGTVAGASGTGVAVGYRQTGGVKNNYKLLWTGTGTPTPSNFNGLDGTTAGEIWAISSDGTRIFGRSPVSDGRAGTWPYMYDGTTIVELPTYPDTAGSTSNAVPYGASTDGRYVVGMNYRGTEKAVLWDTQPLGIPMDLTVYFSSLGMLGNFTRLSRAYSVGVATNGDVCIAGEGAWTPDGGTTFYTRGFVARLTFEPQGACCLHGFGTRTCSVTSQDQCPDPNVWTEGQTCASVCPTCGIPFADVDFDGSVDQLDFALFQTCYTGFVSPAPTLTDACRCLDRDIDSQITSDDLAEFELCATGAGVAWSAEATPGCTPGTGQLP